MLQPRNAAETDALKHLVSDAATLEERLGATRDRAQPVRLSLAGSSTPVTPEALESLAPWIRAFSPGDPQALVRRLEWDGLDLDTLLEATESPLQTDADWIRWVASFVAEARRGALPPSAFRDEGDLPFVELWRPTVAAARAELARRAGRLLEALSPAARDALEQRLLRDATTVGEHAAYERFCSEAQRAYEAFVERMLAGELTRFFADYPVLPRLLATLAESWVAAVHELLVRLDADRAALGESFAAAVDLGRVETIEPSLGDRHEGGRRVMALGFANGTTVVYKPRDVGVEHAWSALVRWAIDRGLDLPPALRVLERPGYGWVEFVSQRELTEPGQARRYFRRAGALLCLAHVLRGRDLHMENVVASADGPQLVDTEMLLQPERARAEDADEPHRGALPPADSCLGSGLLSLLQSDGQGGVFDVGGLRGGGEGRPPLARRAWRSVGTDAVHFVREARFEPNARNAVVLRGQPRRPDDYADDVTGGFEEAYAFLRAQRRAMLAADGPLRAFAGRRVRVLFRTSTQYGALLYVLTAGQYQRSGLERSYAQDALNRCFAGARQRPALWPLVADERRALERLDIPRFTIDSTATVVQTAHGETIRGLFSRSGYDCVVARLRALAPEDCALQVDCLRGALAGPLDGRLASAPPPPRASVLDRPLAAAPAALGSREASEEEALLLEHARWIGRELLARACPTPEGLAWPTPPYAGSRRGAGPLHLYDGAAGPALFLCALSALTREPEERAAATAWALATRARELCSQVDDHEPIGAASGLSSVAYALGAAGGLLGDDGLVDAALDVASAITAERIRADRRLDVAGGAAGAALVLCALFEQTGDRRLLDRAVLCAERLLEAAVEPMAGALAWPAVDGRLLAGMGHGAAGIACALARVGDAAGRTAFLEAARAGWAYERTLFSASHRNWPVLPSGRPLDAGGGPKLMAAWCHGAPGVGLARALTLERLSDGLVREEIEQAMRTTLEAASRGNDHLCCGRCGRIDALLVAGGVLGRNDWTDAARGVAATVARQAGARGRFTLPSSEFEFRVFDPGFFKGLAGIGYELLRAAAPARVPSVLAWQLPARGGERR